MRLACAVRSAARGRFAPPAGGDLLIMAGGLGLAPVRPVIYHAIRNRRSFRRVSVLVGARGPEHMLYRKELDAWHQWMGRLGIELGLSVDVPTTRGRTARAW